MTKERQSAHGDAHGRDAHTPPSAEKVLAGVERKDDRRASLCDLQGAMEPGIRRCDGADRERKSEVSIPSRTC